MHKLHIGFDEFSFKIAPIVHYQIHMIHPPTAGDKREQSSIALWSDGVCNGGGVIHIAVYYVRVHKFHRNPAKCCSMRRIKK